MGISIVCFEQKNKTHWGIWQKGNIAILPSAATGLKDFLERKGWQEQPIENVDSKDVLLLSPVTAPCQIICQGKNYLDHILETGVNPKNKDFNLLFTKAASALAPPIGEVQRPQGVKLLDYELELGLVIGRALTKPTEIKDDNLSDFVAGLVMANDISARDVQIPERQWFKGKSFRGFCPVGPILYLLEPKDFSHLFNLELQLTVNGEKRQQANTKQLLHRPAETLAEISKIFDLRPGDLVLTGTPGGVAMKVKPKSWWQEMLDINKSDKEKFAAFVEEQARSPRYLRDGDQIESSIRSPDGEIDLGVQRVRVRG